jgi:hypothetical protein
LGGGDEVLKVLVDLGLFAVFGDMQVKRLVSEVMEMFLRPDAVEIAGKEAAIFLAGAQVAVERDKAAFESVGRLCEPCSDAQECHQSGGFVSVGASHAKKGGALVCALDGGDDVRAPREEGGVGGKASLGGHGVFSLCDRKQPDPWAVCVSLLRRGYGILLAKAEADRVQKVR